MGKRPNPVGCQCFLPREPAAGRWRSAMEASVGPTIRVTAKQIRFLLGSGRAWMVQPLHVPDGVPKDLQGYHRVPLEEERRHRRGLLKGAQELDILRALVAVGFMQRDA